MIQNLPIYVSKYEQKFILLGFTILLLFNRFWLGSEYVFHSYRFVAAVVDLIDIHYEKVQLQASVDIQDKDFQELFKKFSSALINL